MTPELIKAVDLDNVRLLYDPANTCRAVKETVPVRYQGWDLRRETEELLPFIAHVHIKNYHYDPSHEPKPFVHVSAGKGDIDFEPIFRLFETDGYAGWCLLEPEVGYGETMESMQWMKTLIA